MVIGDGTRLIVISGAFGTGKTEIAINLAIRMRDEGQPRVTLVDLDIVNLYFRSRQKAHDLEQRGIRVISAAEGFEHADMPALSPAIYSAFDARDSRVVFDLGGSDLGGTVAGMFHDGFAGEPYQHWLVVNPYRPFNETADATVEMALRIEARSRLRITGMIANPHLLDETTPALVRDGLDRVRQISAYPLVCLSVMDRYYSEEAFAGVGVPVFVIGKQMNQPWEPGGIVMSGRRGKRCP